MAARPEQFLIWGGGGHGKVVADLVRALGAHVAGFVDRDPDKLGQQVEPGGGRVNHGEKEFLGFVQHHQSFPPGCDAIALAVGDNRIREQCARRLVDLPIPSLVHPRSTVSPSAKLGRGTVVFAGAVLHADARLGDAVIVNTGAIVEHDCNIADACHLSPGATLSGGVRIGERSWIGAAATIIHGVTVGSDVIVGAGAVIIQDVPDGVTVVGNPARVIREPQAV